MKTKDIKKIKKTVRECCELLMGNDISINELKAIGLIDPRFRRDLDILATYLNDYKTYTAQEAPKEKESSKKSNGKNKTKLDKIGFDMES